MTVHVFPRPAAPVFLGYAERAYFTSDACQHCADRDEHRRVKSIERRARTALFGR